jgi:hypothetical protein
VTAADLAPVLAGLGGVSGIGAAVRWWLDRSERIRREDLAREDARAEASVARGQATGAALTSAADSVRALASAVERVPVALDAMDDRLDARFERIERALAEIRAHVAPLTGEHRAGGA